METLSRLTAPAATKIRQLQKIVQDIKKNDGSLLDRLRRLKSKARPAVPVRDYRDDNRENDQLSETDNETYEDPHGDDNYEPPPSHREFTSTHLPSLGRGEYLDRGRERPIRPPKKPFRPGTSSKQLPPEPSHQERDNGDYVDPDVSDDEDEDGDNDGNYVEPSENPAPNPMSRNRNKAGRNPHMFPAHVLERSPSPDFYEVPEKEETSTSPQTNRLCPVKKTHSLPKPYPRMNRRSPPPPIHDPTGEDEYEVCDPHDSASPPALPYPQKSLPKQSPKAPLGPKPDSNPKKCESKSLPVVQAEQKPPPKAFSLDIKRPKIPFPHFTLPKTADNNNVAVESWSTEDNKDADVSNRPWFALSCDRRTADDALLSSNKDGAFMVRKSSGQDARQPYTLVVFYKGRVYNIPIRYLPATQQYALGREKKGEEYFSSVSHIIENHQRNPLVLIDSQSNTKDATKLCYPMKP
uniref:B-cell linker n=3 Tax=Iconisemion striatum TaxID=60296 RepID=A0A1A7XN59_9TELE